MKNKKSPLESPQERLESAILKIRALDYQCKVCSAVPDLWGDVQHGRGCYQVSESGGGIEHVEHKGADLLLSHAGAGTCSAYNKPSISELQKTDAQHTVHGVLWDTWPVLLEIVAAAQKFVATQGDRTEPEWGELTLALSKVLT